MSFQDQLISSGARPALDGQDADYTVYVNVPERSSGSLARFLAELKEDVKATKPVCVADVNIERGMADQALFESLWNDGSITKLLSYAAWNTAGNTMGTTIPAANVYLLALKSNEDARGREIAQREFLLHRIVNDFAYHRYSRPIAYAMIDSDPNASREETYGRSLYQINDAVRRDLTKWLDLYYSERFQGAKFTAGDKLYEIDGLKDVKIGLPWPRAYEVRMDFRLDSQEVATSKGAPSSDGG